MYKITAMENHTKPLTNEESLHIITAMIRQTKGNFQGQSFHLLLWGWVVVLINLGIFFVLSFTSYPSPFYLWALTIPAALVSFGYGWRQSKKAKVKTHLDKVNSSLWVCFSLLIFTLIVFGPKINWQLNPVILLITAVPTLVSGVIMRFKPLMYGSIIFWLMGISCFMVPFEVQHLLAALAITLGYLVPGYLLKNAQ